MYAEQDHYKLLERIAIALERIASWAEASESKVEPVSKSSSTISKPVVTPPSAPGKLPNPGVTQSAMSSSAQTNLKFPSK
jgi:hypothetical protein